MTGPGAGTEANKALARRWLQEGWGGGDLDLAGEVFAPGFTLRGRRVGPDGPRRSVSGVRAAFAGLAITVDLQVAEGDLVVTHFTATGRHVGEYRGIAPTGRTVTASGIQIWTVHNGRAIADVNVFDEWGMVEQLRA
ncbi:ester cyclase [Actinomadura roseirufa]|uniref:ester cyclase n=1 Tax=Actinomadura roseirufa TaxID=2094049 RepID=UPI001041AC72|nr:ester cyclase [Actinomadura roseirufa]